MSPFVRAAIVQGAMLASVVMLGVVAGILPGRDRIPEYEKLLYAVSGAAIVAAGAGIGLYFKMTSPERMAGDEAAAVQRWTAAVIVRAALFESIAIYGLILRLVGGTPTIYAIFGGAAAFLLLGLWPTPGSFDRRRGR